MNHLTRAKSVFEMEIEELRGVLSRLDDNFNKAVDLMSQALDRGNKIVIVGVGKSGNIGAKIVATLNSTGTPTVLLDSLNACTGIWASSRTGMSALPCLLRRNLGAAGPAPLYQTF